MLTDDDLQIQDGARRFARERLIPQSAAWDRGEPVPDALLREMGELGYLGLLIPEEYGGSGACLLTYVVALEEISAGNGGLSTLMHVHGLGTAGPIARFGTPAQKQRWLPAMASGEAIGAVCLTEPNAGSDVAAIRTRAVRSEGGWRLSGVKQFISNGARAKIAIVLAVTDPHAGRRGMTLFLVPTDTPGFKVGKPEEKMGQRTSDTVQITLDDCEVPEDAILGGLNQAFGLTMGLLSDGRISIAAQAVGMASAALDHAVAYARERTAFGKPLTGHQAVAFRLADMATSVEVARTFTQATARKFDAGVDCVSEASMAKLFAGEMAERVCSDAIQIHGGYGYLKDYPVERIYRDVRVCQIYEGTNDIQRLIISRKVCA
ncbi:MAG: Acyl-CoA dehydrogenase [Hydrocarboniphaga sp.]|uniref:acyl-CoA dehydrogenase family protein n=1 Tax=Hydrocarboniphaga sp. TaxID=2033016 RepID=UPI00262DAF7B|nr:acyl-CoA dehydrogenase family protein [Hydrocarboniphaga sp.]MDB5971168.1 Acyl-CoA dehydrogenase [Hydrocarboniphaga sp.]